MKNALAEHRRSFIVAIIALLMFVAAWAVVPKAELRGNGGEVVGEVNGVADLVEVKNKTVAAESTENSWVTEELTANAIRSLAGCTTNSLGAIDDGSSAAIALPFSINYFGVTYSQTYVNNNGNITFTGPLGTYTPFSLASTNTPIIAPFFADVDTRGTGSGVTQYGTTTVNGRSAFCVNWVNVGFYNSRADKLNSFQLILINRSDTGTNNFDIEFNYNQIAWETGNSSGGTDGLGGNSARAGYANGTTAVGTFLELPGSAVNGGLLDTNFSTGLTNKSSNSGVTGRYIFNARNGAIPTPTPASPTPTPTPQLVVTQHLTTPGPIPDACGTPTVKTTFNTLDATALQWTVVSGFQNGSLVRWDWVQPNGTIYRQFEGTITNPNSNICFWDGMSIAGTAAAQLLGNWQVRLFYKGSLISTDNFTISAPPPPLVQQHLTTAGPIPDSCGTPAAKTSFTTLDPTVLQWTSISGSLNGSAVRVDWVQPNGSIFKQDTGTINNTNPNICFWDGMNIAGTAAAALVGSWQARVYYNNVLIATDNFTINAPPPPTVSEHLTTPGPILEGCSTPPARTTYYTVDATVQQWTSISGNLNGSAVRWEWVQPNGSIFKQLDATINNSNPNICFWDAMNIAGTSAAALLGNWQVRVFYNGVLIATDNFTISTTPPPTVFEHLTTAGPIPNGCGTPPAKTSFTTLDPTVLQWTSISGNTTGSAVRWEWVQPNGSIFKQFTGTINNTNSNICVFDGMSIAGTGAAALPGTWQVRVFYNGTLIATDNFTISTVPPPNVFEHSTTAGPIPNGCGTPIAKTSFSATDATVLQWTSISGHQNGSIVRWEWVQPNGTVFKQFEAPINNTNSNICFWDGMSIAGTGAASLPGNWKVRVYYNGILLATDDFTIGGGGSAAECGKPEAALTTFGNVVLFSNVLASNTPAQKLVTGLPGGNGTQGVAYFGDRVLAMDAQNTGVSKGIFIIQASTGTLLDTINPGTGFNGTGTIAVSPDASVALAMGGPPTLFVVRAPFNASSIVQKITLPGSFHTGQTQGIVFDSAGRAFVSHTQGVSVLDPPYNSVAFEIKSGAGISPIAITPDGKTLLLGGDSAKIRIIKAPFSAASVVENLALPPGQSIAGIMVTPDGTKALAVGFPRAVFAISAPFTSSSTVESLPLPATSGSAVPNFEDVGISADGQIAVATGGDPPSEAPVFIRAPFTAAAAQSYYVPIQGGIGRNRGAVRFQPACQGTMPPGVPGAGNPTPSPAPTGTPTGTPTPIPTPDASGMTADYQFQNTRNSSTGGPPLTDLINLSNGANTFTTEAIDGCAPRSVLSFPKGNGLSLVPTTGLTTDNKTYTIVMLFKFADQDRSRAIIDFRNNPTDDRGVYASPDNNLNFYNTQNNGPGISVGDKSPLTANKWVQVVFTRQESDVDKKDADVGYVDKVHQYLLESNGADGIVDPQSNTLRFFLNQPPPESTDYSAGSVARIRIFNRALSKAEVEALDRLPGGACGTPTPTPGPSGSPTPSPSPTTGPTPTPTATPVASPTSSPTPTATPGASPTPDPSCNIAADYQFQNSLNSSVGSPPPLANLGNNTFATAPVDGTPRTVLQFPELEGLSLSPTTGVVSNSVYTVAVLFKFNSNDGYRRILDFKNSSEEPGLYNQDGKLVFYRGNGMPSVIGPSVKIPVDTFVQVVLTRDAAKNVTGYVNGEQQFTFADTGDLALIDVNNKLIFFRDNNRNGEASGGSVARIRLYNRVLTTGEVGQLEQGRASGGGCGATGPTPTPTPGTSCTALPSGLKYWYRAEGNAIDTTSGANGTPTGNITYPAGKVGQTFSFPGGESYVTLPALNLGGAFSLEFWMNPAVADQPYRHVISNDFGSPNYGALYYVNGKLAYWKQGAIFDTTNALPINQWTHAALVYDGNVVRLYINGVLDRTSGQLPGITFNTAVKLADGINRDSSLTYNGGLDEVSFYNVALSGAQVASIYNAGTFGKCAAGSGTPTPAPSGSPTATPTATPAATPTATATATPISTPSATPTATATATPTGTPGPVTLTVPGTNLGAIPDGSCAGPGRQIQFVVSGVTGPISDIRVSLTGTHAYVGDLDAILIDPGATTSQFLFTYTGNDLTPQFGDSSDFSGPYTFFDSAANNWWTAAAAVDGITAIPPGNYKPSNANGAVVSLDGAFANVNPNGTWILKVNDCLAPDAGAISSASLRFTAATVTATISGRILTPGGSGLRNAIVALTDAQGVRRTTITSTLGFYSFDAVRLGEQYTLTSTSKRYRFLVRTELLTVGRSDLDLVGLE
jgi:hypothetical protein